MLARDLMIPLLENLTPGMSLREAACVLRTASRDEERVGVKGLPVLDLQGRMVGFLSIGDILKAVFPAYLASTSIGDFSWDGMVEEMVQRVVEKRVADLMTTRVITVPEEAPLMVCIDHMIKTGVKRLPVIGPGGRVTGIIYERDVFTAITDILNCAAKECRR